MRTSHHPPEERCSAARPPLVVEPLRARLAGQDGGLHGYGGVRMSLQVVLPACCCFFVGGRRGGGGSLRHLLRAPPGEARGGRLLPQVTREKWRHKTPVFARSTYQPLVSVRREESKGQNLTRRSRHPNFLSSSSSSPPPSLSPLSITSERAVLSCFLALRPLPTKGRMLKGGRALCTSKERPHAPKTFFFFLHT